MLSRRQRQTQVPHVDPRTQAHIDSRAVIGPQQRRDELMPLRVQHQVGIAAVGYIVPVRPAQTMFALATAVVRAHTHVDIEIFIRERRAREGFHSDTPAGTAFRPKAHQRHTHAMCDA